MAKSRVKVGYNDLPTKELRQLAASQSTKSERDKVFRALLGTFKKQVIGTGVLSECKQREYYESPGEKRRRKMRESARERSKNHDR